MHQPQTSSLHLSLNGLLQTVGHCTATATRKQANPTALSFSSALSRCTCCAVAGCRRKEENAQCSRRPLAKTSRRHLASDSSDGREVGGRRRRREGRSNLAGSAVGSTSRSFLFFSLALTDSLPSSVKRRSSEEAAACWGNSLLFLLFSFLFLFL